MTTNEERLRELTETGKSVRRTGRSIMTMIEEALFPDGEDAEAGADGACTARPCRNDDHYGQCGDVTVPYL